ncbi:MAG TPA: ABC transporter permease, partial [Verrucomicrobiae bacterium]|nr:ABC transporter permease [Verrucomicrobiae bacterium]
SYREQRGIPFIDTLLQDVRYGLRMLRKSPGFTIVAVLTLALGIGANTALFSILNAVLLKPLPYRNAERLTMIWQSDAAHRGSGAWFNTYGEFDEWAHHSQSFEKIAAFTWARVPPTIRLNGKVENVNGIPVSADFFAALGARAAEGRTFTTGDADSPCSAVLSDAFWRGRLGGQEIVGHTLTINDQRCKVVGIMPKDFSFYPKATQIWTLIQPQGDFAQHPWDSLVGVLGLLKLGVTRAAAEAELAALQSRIVAEAPPNSIPPKAEPDVLDLQSEFIWLTGRNLRTSLIVLFAAVCFVLLIACVNVATLFLGRSTERQKEFAVRAALGSSRLRIVRQLLTESLLLAAGGAVLGIVLAIVAIRYINSSSFTDLPPGNVLAIDSRTLVFTALLAIVSTLIFGLLPGWKASRQDVNTVLKSGSRSTQRAAKVFIVSEVALSLMLLAGAGLLIQSLFRMTNAPLGFEPSHLLVAEIDLPQKKYSNAREQLNFYNELRKNVSGIPGLKGIAFGPMVTNGNSTLSVEGENVSARGAASGIRIGDAVVDAKYFRVMEIPLLRGRDFDSGDQHGTSPVAIVNEKLAEEYFHGNPLGQHIKLGKPEDKAPWLTIIGVVGNVKSFSVFKEMGYVTDPCVYRPLTQDANGAESLFVRSAENAKTLTPELLQAFSKINSSLPAPDVYTMDEWLGQFLSQPRLRAILLGAFAALGLILCSIGIFGVLSQSVTQRRREIGIRMALGAQGSDTIGLVIREGMLLTLAGLIMGIVGALSLTRLISGLLYGVSAADPLTFAAVAGLLLLVALGASYLPARRAAHVDPMVALREE